MAPHKPICPDSVGAETGQIAEQSNGTAIITPDEEEEAKQQFGDDPSTKPKTGAARAAEIAQAHSRISAGVAAHVAEWQRLTPEEIARRKLPFALVPLADLCDAEPAPPMYAWERLIPIGHVTNLSAHGGTGKSVVSIQLAISVATGRPLFGRTTLRGPVVLFSGEDGKALLRYRMKLLCGAMGVNIADLEGKLHILDATEGDPTLFAELNIAGQRMARPTPTYEALRAFCKQHEARLVVIDNASDAFDANENDRSRVRAFMRTLARIARECDCAVLLLAHVDKSTSRQERAGTEGYSGSTAWHNSARSRMWMRREADGTLVLEHQKNNLGSLSDPIRLTWPENGVPMLAAPSAQQGNAGEARALLRLIDEFSKREEYVATMPTSPTNATRLLSGEQSYPARLKARQVHALLRDAERHGLIVRERYRDDNRKERERWTLTEAGAKFVAATDEAAL